MVEKHSHIIANVDVNLLLLEQKGAIQYLLEFSDWLFLGGVFAMMFITTSLLSLAIMESRAMKRSQTKIQKD